MIRYFNMSYRILYIFDIYYNKKVYIYHYVKLLNVEFTTISNYRLTLELS